MFRQATTWESLFALSASESNKLIVIRFTINFPLANKDIDEIMMKMGKRHPKINSLLVLRDKKLYWEPRQEKNYTLLGVFLSELSKTPNNVKV